jgi:flavin reductase (DIM6/NTAB) family NADH-FMN oxidoreductase RutF
MLIDTSTNTTAEIYYALLSLVTPRPIAWVTTIDAAGHVNLAPFSFFNAVGASPPVVAFAPSLKPDGSKKDTLINLGEVPEFVINAATLEFADQVNASSAALPHGQSEAEMVGLAVEPSLKVRPPRLTAAKAHIECRVRQIIALGDGPNGANLVLGDVLAIHVHDDVLDSDGRIDPHKYQTIARLGGEWYCRATDLFTLKRPS